MIPSVHIPAGERLRIIKNKKLVYLTCQLTHHVETVLHVLCNHVSMYRTGLNNAFSIEQRKLLNFCAGLNCQSFF